MKDKSYTISTTLSQNSWFDGSTSSPQAKLTMSVGSFTISIITFITMVLLVLTLTACGGGGGGGVSGEGEGIYGAPTTGGEPGMAGDAGTTAGGTISTGGVYRLHHNVGSPFEVRYQSSDSGTYETQ